MTDKERLESIKRSSEYVTYREMGNDSVVRVEIVISENHFNWLIEQAGRVQELEEENKRQREALEEIEEHAVWGMFTNKYVIMARKGLGLLEVEELK